MSDPQPIFEPLGPATDSLRSTSLRGLTKLLATPLPTWVIAPDGSLAYLSASCGQWLGVAPQALLGRSTRGDSTEPLDAIAQALTPTTDAWHGVTEHTLHPPAADPALPLPTPQRVTFLELPQQSPPATPNPNSPNPNSTGDGAEAAHHDRTPSTSPPDAASRALLAVAMPLQRSGRPRAARQTALLETVRKALAADPRRLKAIPMLGDSVAAARLRAQLHAATLNQQHLLIIGPLGGGASLLAHWIQSASTTNDTPSATHNLAWSDTSLVTVAGSLMDAELFDATTGNLMAQFLDDTPARAALLVEQIDQMPADAQERLELLINNAGPRLRVFATSTQHGAALWQSLRPALVVALGACTIDLPALAERREDLPLLASSLLHRRRQNGETRADHIGREALDRLLQYPWPGDFDELDAAIRNAAKQCRGETIQLAHLPLAIRSYGQPQPPADPLTPTPGKLKPLDEHLADTEREHIRRALQSTNGNRAAAARLLEISRPRLLRRIEQLGIE